MKVLFIGGTGTISTAVSKLAVERGMELTLLTRGHKDALAPVGARILHGDINDAAQMKRLLAGERFDAIVDWVAFDLPAIERDIRLFEGMTDQYIFISSAAAYQKTGQHFIDESTPLYNPGWQYAVNKAACEERLMWEYREKGFPVTIVRPAHTYGDTSIPFALTSWSKPWTLVDRMLRGKKIIVPGDGTSLWTLTHNTDFALGFVGLLGNSQALGHAFHITSDEARTWDEYLTAIGRAAGAEPKPIHIASEAIERFMPELGGSLLRDTCCTIILDNSKIKRFVPGYQAVIGFDMGIRQSIQYFLSHPETMEVDEAVNNKMDRLIDAYDRFLNEA